MDKPALDRFVEMAKELSRHWNNPNLRNLIAAALRQQHIELNAWQQWGTIEVAVRNPNVRSYMDHWEGRAEKAEAESAKLREALIGARDIIRDFNVPTKDDPEANEIMREIDAALNEDKP